MRGDICNGELVADLFRNEKFDAVMHLAAESHVDRSILAPSIFIETNVRGTQVLLEAAREFGVKRFLHVSTDEVYGSLGPTGLFTERTPLDPSSPYSASKAASDLLALAYFHTFKLPVVVTRCSNNYGPYQFPEKLIPLMIANAIRDLPLPVYGDGMNVRDWIHVEDHGRGLLAALEQGEPGQVYNFGASSERHNIDIVKQVLELVGKPESLIQYVKDRLGHDRRYAIDSPKAQAKLGWAPRHRFEEALAETVRWYEDNRPWWERIISGEYLKYYEKQYGSPAVKVAITGANGMLGGEAVAQLAGTPRGAGARLRSGAAAARGPTPGSRPTSATASRSRGRCSPSARRRCSTPARSPTWTGASGSRRRPGGSTSAAPSRWPGPAARWAPGWWPSPPTTSSTARAARTARKTCPTRAASTRRARWPGEWAALLHRPRQRGGPGGGGLQRPGHGPPTFATQVVDKLGSGEVGEGLRRPVHLHHAGRERRRHVPGAAPRARLPGRAPRERRDRHRPGGLRPARGGPLRPHGEDRGREDRQREAARPPAAPGGLKVDRAAGMLRNRPLGIDEALDRFHAEWARRTAS